MDDYKYFSPAAREEITRIIDEHSIHPWRWRSLGVFVVLLSLLCFFALRGSAPVSDLQSTDCKLKTFMLTARIARLQQSKDPKATPKIREQAKGAADAYLQLANGFGHGAIGDCHISPKLLVGTSETKLGGR